MDTYDHLQKERKAVLERLEQWASKANMTPQERAQYERENGNTIMTSIIHWTLLNRKAIK